MSIRGNINLKKKIFSQSYDVTIQLQRVGSDIVASNTLDLKNPYFRYSGTAAAPPPGSNTTSPSEAWWNTLDERGAIYLSVYLSLSLTHNFTLILLELKFLKLKKIFLFPFTVSMTNGISVNGLTDCGIDPNNGMTMSECFSIIIIIEKKFR